MKPQCCKNCIYFNPQHNPETGRVLPTKPGTCSYEVVIPLLPDSVMVFDQWREKLVLPELRKRFVFMSNGETCQTYSPVIESVKKEKQKRLDL